MDTWKNCLGDLYECIDVLKQDGEKQVALLYDKQGKQLCVMKQQPLETADIYRTLKALGNRHIPRIHRVFQEEGHLVYPT